MEKVKDLFESFYEEFPEFKAEQEKFRLKLRENIKKERLKAGELLLTEEDEVIEDTIKNLSEKEIFSHISSYDRMIESLKREYHQRMNKRVFDVSKTTFNELIKKNSWISVKEKLNEIYQVENMDSYEKVFNELLTLNPSVNKEKLVIVVKNQDVTGIKPYDMSGYAIEFCRWEEWLGFFASNESIQEMSETEFIAHCLWEMTFIGYSQEEIKDESITLDKQVANIKKHLNNGELF